MTDPLAIASGIAGLLSLGIQVTQSLVNFYNAYNDQDTNLAKVAQNLHNLLGIFRALDIAVEERRPQADTQDLLREVEQAVQKCQDIITELQGECEKFQKDSAASLKDRVKVAGRRVAYPFRKTPYRNALVLEYLLRPENSVAFIADQDKPSVSDAQVLLDMVADLDPPAQVILDVGAQILELSNLEVAQHWLKILPKEGPIQAIVFVNNDDEICVLDRNGRVEPLQISPFARQMEACFVFLDEAHTRGIDLKLPRTYRAAVTLGAGITKDKLVQACMRMRNLGNGQSVVFCIPQEIKFNILTLNGKNSKLDINVLDVLCWAVTETWRETRRSIPLWAVQGRRFERQLELWHNAHQDNPTGMTESQAESFLEPESQTLENRYRPGHGDSPTMHPSPDRNRNLSLISERCREFDVLKFASSTLQEEQERELAPEIERKRQVQRPPEATPERHQLHPNLRSFVTTATLNKSSDAYKPAFQALGNTSAASFLDVSQFPSGLLVTRDFATTVQMPRGSRFIADAFQRPVQWILTSAKRESPSSRKTVAHMIVISPYEADHLLPESRHSNYVTLHLYAPRQNQGLSPLDKIRLYNVPSGPDTIEIPETLRIQLNLFAGQLYLGSYSEYLRLCDFLGVASVKTADGLVFAADGFVVQGNESKTAFRQSPLKFLKVLMSQIRKHCREIDKKHLGHIVDGRLLCLSDFLDPITTTTTLESGRLNEDGADEL